MRAPYFVVSMFSIGVTILGIGTASGQNFPVKTIRIVTTAIGGPADFNARQIAPGISGSLGQQVVVENRGGGTASGEAVAKAPADGYTLLSTGGTLWVGPLIQKTPYDIKDFAPVSLVTTGPLVVVVHPSLPVKSIKELVALAKARPGDLNYASGGTGGTTHLSGELFKNLAGVNIVRIFYKSGDAQMSDLLSGEVQMTFGPAVEMMPLVKAGKLKALASTSAQPSPLLPGLPTVAASGVPGYEMASRTGMFAPAKTPAAIISRLNQEIVRFLSTPEVKQRFFNNGVEVVASSPEHLASVIEAEVARLGKVVKEAGIKGG